jgi:hypothetical protein
MGDERLSTSFRAGLRAILIAYGMITLAACSTNGTAPPGSGAQTTGSGGGTAGTGGATGTGGAVTTPGTGSDASAPSDMDAAASAPPADGAAGASGADGSVSSDVAAGGPRSNIALKKPATASSIEHAGREPELIDDGDQVTRWVGGAAVYPQWNSIDLQAAHNIDTVAINPYMSRAYQFLLEGSLDGMNYFTLSDQRANTVGGTTITVSFAAQRTRFVRITVSGASGYAAGWTAINEMDIYESR